MFVAMLPERKTNEMKSKTRKFWEGEIRRYLTEYEFIELNHRMNRLLRRDDAALGEYDELLAEFGLEPDYLLAWIG